MDQKKTAVKYRIGFRQWFLTIVTLFVVPLSVGMIVVTGYVGNAVRNQLYIGNENLVAVYIQKLDESLAGLDRFLRGFPEQNIDLSVLAVSRDDSQRYISKTTLLAELHKTILVYDGAVDGMFILSHGPDEVFISSGRLSGGEEAQIQDIARDMLANGRAAGRTGWHWMRIEDENYLINLIANGSNCVGAWIRIENLMGPLKNIDLGVEGIIFVAAQDGTPLYATETSLSYREKYLQIGRESQVSNISIQVLIPEKEVSGKVVPIQLFIVGVFGIILLLALLVIYLFEQQVRRPITSVTAAMRKIRQGDFSVHVPEKALIREVRDVSESFNAMSRRIETLTRDVYERTIQEQKTRLQYLQMQIKPHFFLNTLNLIYSFAEIGRSDLIQKLTLSMVEYFRYNFVNTSDFVPLRGEVRHVENYLEIQRLRFPGAFCYRKELDQTLLDMSIPPLILQTFVENSIKYAMDDEQECRVELHITRNENRPGFVNICIEDNGEGYPADVLEKFKKGLPLSADKKQGIGILNVCRRLELLYGEKNASVMLENLPGGGARSVLSLPESPVDKK